MDEGDLQLIGDIEKYGWHVLLLEEEEFAVPYGFSVGLYHTYKHPEIVIFGLNHELTHQIINNIGGGIAGGNVYESGREYADIVAIYDCAFVEVDRKYYSEYLGYAQWFYKNDDFPVLQVFWPDKQQNYPWHQAFYEPWRDKQEWLISDYHAERLRTTGSLEVAAVTPDSAS